LSATSGYAAVNGATADSVVKDINSKVKERSGAFATEAARVAYCAYFGAAEEMKRD
jgi:hypothetical protein